MAQPKPEVIEALLDARGLSWDDVARRIGVSRSELVQQILHDKGPSEKIIKDLSSELAVPSFVLFMSRAPNISSTLVDFRKSTPRRVALSRAAIESIDTARAIQKIAEENQHYDTLERVPSVDDLPASAARIRRALSISAEAQKGAKDAREFYGLLRRAIESLGIFVLHDSFSEEDGSGFCIADGPAAIIVINTRRQNIGRRIFTLVHELGHALLRSTGISDPFVLNNRVERACNSFAARLLMPRNLLIEAAEKYHITLEPSTRQIYLLSRFLKVSQEAAVIRLEQLKVVSPGSHARWLESVQGTGNPDWITDKGGPANVPQEKIKLARYGITFARVFNSALNKGDLTPIDVYRISGLKPKFQRPYFSFAEEMGSDYDLA